MSIENINWDKTGGPAFPATFDDCSNDVYIHGMSLRDWFAGQFLAGCASSPYTHASIANACYAMADAMLAERAKAKGEQV
jgi:hypothetical protein